jgi:plasmid stabilization system protein ParE
MTIIFTELARQDINAIVHYISSDLHNPIAANNLLEKLFKGVKVLGKFPEVGSRIKINDTLTQTRYLVIDNYLLLYAVKDASLYVTRVVYGQSDYLRLLSE